MRGSLFGAEAMVGYRFAFKPLEVVASMAFLVLCGKTFCVLFYKDQVRAHRERRQQIAFIRDAPPLVPLTTASKKIHHQP
jgi:hypothetical protein